MNVRSVLILIIFCLVFIESQALAEDGWEIVRKESRMAGTISVSAYVSSTDAVHPKFLGAADSPYRPRLWIDCSDDKLRIGVDYGLHEITKGASAHVDWRVNGQKISSEKNWYITRDRQFVSPGSGRSSILNEIRGSNGDLAFQISFLGSFSNNIRDPDSTYTTFSLSGA